MSASVPAKKPRRVRPANFGAIEAIGEALRVFAQTGDSSKLHSAIINLENLADCLIAIARGEDAREVFGQAGRGGRQSERLHNFARSIAYWYARAKHPEDKRGAVERGQAQFSYLPAPKPATILRNATADRAAVFEILQGDFTWRGANDAEHYPNGVDLTALRACLERRSKHSR